MCAINRLVEWGKNETPGSVQAKCETNPNLLVQDIFGWTMAHLTDPEALMDETNSLATLDEMKPYTYKESDWIWEQRPGATEGFGYHTIASSSIRIDELTDDEIPEDLYYDEEPEYPEEDY
jgi:hypothetical protein